MMDRHEGVAEHGSERGGLTGVGIAPRCFIVRDDFDDSAHGDDVERPATAARFQRSASAGCYAAAAVAFQPE
jgi:hypothetical protein